MTPHPAFELLSNPLGKLARLVIRHASGAELEVLSGFGAGLNAWRIPTTQGMVELLSGYASESDLNTRHADTSAGVRLSPFPNRLNGGKWNWSGLSGELPINFKWQPHAIHGLLHTKAWEFVSFKSDMEAAELTLRRHWDGAHLGYPFPFTATSIFRLEAHSFSVRSQTQNQGTTELPYGEGWHPYFSLGAPVDELQLQLPPVQEVMVNDLSIPTGERKPFLCFEQSACIQDRFIDNCWAVESPLEVVSTHLHHPVSGRSLEIWQQNAPGQYRYIQAYTPPDRQSIAIEPMTCEPDVLNHHRDLMVIPPQQSVELCWGARFYGSR